MKNESIWISSIELWADWVIKKWRWDIFVIFKSSVSSSGELVVGEITAIVCHA
jgi:hypothetical protein